MWWGGSEEPGQQVERSDVMSDADTQMAVEYCTCAVCSASGDLCPVVGNHGEIFYLLYAGLTTSTDTGRAG